MKFSETRTSHEALRLDTRTSAVKKSPVVQLWWMDLDNGAAAHFNRGDLTQQRMKAGSGSIITKTYEYDRLNRLTKVTDTGLPSPQEFLIDRWGNRAFKTGSYLAPGFPVTQVNAVIVASQAEVDAKFPKNRISHQGAGYDNAGNMIQLEGRPVDYDFEGRITKMTASTGSTSSEERLWFYDGEGRRVREEHWQVDGSTRTFKWETVFVYDPLGALVAEYDTRAPGTAGTRYLTVDHLGSTRMVTKESGTTEAQVVDTRHDYLPFGEEVRSTGGPKEKFTGKERADVVGTRVDYFGARYMSAMLGRFTSPDAPLVDQHPEGPQSWNLYAYTANNPLTRIDPEGLNWFNIGGAWQWHDGSDVDSSGRPCRRGTDGCNHSDYTHLVVFEITSQDRKSHAAHGTLTLYGSGLSDVLAQTTAYSGGKSDGRDRPHAGIGNYRLNLTRGAERLGPADQIEQDGGRYVTLRTASGIQQMPFTSGPWGDIRIKMNEWVTPSRPYAAIPPQERGLFMHNSFDRVRTTHGCVCDHDRVVLNKLWDLATQVGPGRTLNFHPVIPMNVRYRR